MTRPAGGPRTNLWVSGVFWTQNLQPLAVGLTLRVVDVAEQTSGPERDGQTDRCQSKERQLRTRQTDRQTAEWTGRGRDG